MSKLFLTVLLAGVSCYAGAEDIPKGETILDHYIEVTGGKAAYEKVHSEVARGTMEFTGRGLKGLLISYEAEPGKAYTVVEIEGVGKIEEGFDGNIAWERSAMTGPRIKTGEEREETVRGSVYNSHLNWRKAYATAETAGAEAVNGEDCWKVVLTPKTGAPETEFYSKETGLLRKTSSVHSTQMGDIAADSFLDDYKDVSGVKMPFSRVNKLAGQEIAIHLDSIEFNSEIPSGRFDLPEDVKALLRKTGTVNDKTGNDKK